MVTRQLQVERRTKKVRRPKTGVLPLSHAANRVGSAGSVIFIDSHLEQVDENSQGNSRLGVSVSIRVITGPPTHSVIVEGPVLFCYLAFVVVCRLSSSVTLLEL